MEHLFKTNDEYILKAHEFMDEWNYLEAQKLLIRLLEEDPNHGPAHFLLGRIYSSQLQDKGTAIYHFRLAIEHCPILIDAYYYLAYHYIDRGDYGRAIEVCHQALDQPGAAEDLVWYYQAQALEKSGSLIDAKEFYQRALLASIEDETVQYCEDGMRRIDKKLDYVNQKRVNRWVSKSQLA